jgi:tetratricopeptide (TPR) repeat protein
MKTPLLLSLVVGVALLTGAGGSQLVRCDSGSHAGGADDAGAAAQLATVLDRLQSIEREQSGLRHSLDAATLAAHAPSPATTVSGADIEAAVAAYLQEHGAEALASLVPAGAAASATPAEAGPDPSVLFAALLDPELGDQDRQALFDQARKAGILDALLALFEQRARENPNDPAAQLALGEAYIQKIFEVGDGPAAGEWAVKADQSYDAALAIDSGHWDARFAKAVSLSFWPPIFGKQAEAIGHFETLLEQQSSQAPQPKFAQAYLSLGNLYLQSGKSEQALAVFEAGLKLFPGDAELLAKLSP